MATEDHLRGMTKGFWLTLLTECHYVLSSVSWC
jgi:hypothetical protein